MDALIDYRSEDDPNAAGENPKSLQKYKAFLHKDLSRDLAMKFKDEIRRAIESAGDGNDQVEKVWDIVGRLQFSSIERFEDMSEDQKDD